VVGATGGWRGRLEAVEDYLYAKQIIYMKARGFRRGGKWLETVRGGWWRRRAAGDLVGQMASLETIYSLKK